MLTVHMKKVNESESWNKSENANNIDAIEDKKTEKMKESETVVTPKIKEVIFDSTFSQSVGNPSEIFSWIRWSAPFSEQARNVHAPMFRRVKSVEPTSAN